LRSDREAPREVPEGTGLEPDIAPKRENALDDDVDARDGERRFSDGARNSDRRLPADGADGVPAHAASPDSASPLAKTCTTENGYSVTSPAETFPETRAATGSNVFQPSVHASFFADADATFAGTNTSATMECTPNPGSFSPVAAVGDDAAADADIHDSSTSHPVSSPEHADASAASAATFRAPADVAETETFVATNVTACISSVETPFDAPSHVQNRNAARFGSATTPPRIFTNPAGEGSPFASFASAPPIVAERTRKISSFATPPCASISSRPGTAPRSASPTLSSRG
jgi:hypothetical protein